MSSQRFLGLIATVAALTLRSLAASAAPLPNVILCMTDDQGWGDVSYNGNQVLKTPNLDAMAASGLRFDRFYATHHNCSPTRAAVLTGRHPNRYRCYQWGHDLPLREVTLAERVKARGFATGHFGKWHVGGIPNADGSTGRGVPESFDRAPRHPGNQGFDEWFSAGNWFDVDPPAGTLFRNGEPVGALNGDTSDIVMGEALDFVRRKTKEGQPFLCVIWFPSPHFPYKARAEDKAPYAAHGADADFYGEMAGVDRAMGALRDELKRLGIRNNTMLWFNSDNGAMGGTAGPLAGRKGSFWEGGIRVPGILEWPARIAPPRRTDVPVSTADIFPTVCDALGLTFPEDAANLDGISLLPLIDGRLTARPKPIAFEERAARGGKRTASALIDGPWKLLRIVHRIRLHQKTNTEEPPAPGDYLFDLSHDIAETRDVSGQHPDVFGRMRQQLDAFEASVERSAAAYPFAAPRVELIPRMLESDVNIPDFVADSLAFRWPGWREVGRGERRHFDGALQLQGANAERVGLQRPLPSRPVFIQFSFKLGEGGRIALEAGSSAGLKCSAVVEESGAALIAVEGEGAGRQVLAQKQAPIPSGMWHTAALEIGEHEVLFHGEGELPVLVAHLPALFAGDFGISLMREEGVVAVKNVSVAATRPNPNWPGEREKLAPASR